MSDWEGERLGALLSAYDWSQGDMARFLGENKRRISAVYHGREVPPATVTALWEAMETYAAAPPGDWLRAGLPPKVSYAERDTGTDTGRADTGDERGAGDGPRSVSAKPGERG